MKINITTSRFPLALCALCASVIPLLSASPARATDPFEIQVYQDDLNDPGQFALELHANASLKGKTTPEYAGQIAPNHVSHFTLEPALGVTPWLEVGAYLQAFMEPSGSAHFGGVKLRAKMAPKRKEGSPFFYGLNIEVGRVPSTVEEEGWANEFRPFLGYDDGHWLFDVNPIFGYALSGSEKFKPDFEPCGKVGWNTQKGFMVGLEYYSGLGLLFSGFSPYRQQEHMLYAAFDLAAPAGVEDKAGWELNAAIGRSLSDGSPSDWMAKMIVGKAF